MPACIALLLMADVALHTVGLRRAVRLARRFSATAPSNLASRSPDIIAATTRRVAMAASLYPRRALCLEQSLALHVLLGRRGVATDLKIGVHR